MIHFTNSVIKFYEKILNSLFVEYYSYFTINLREQCTSYVSFTAFQNDAGFSIKRGAVVGEAQLSVCLLRCSEKDARLELIERLSLPGIFAIESDKYQRALNALI